MGTFIVYWQFVVCLTIHFIDYGQFDQVDGSRTNHGAPSPSGEAVHHQCSASEASGRLALQTGVTRGS